MLVSFQDVLDSLGHFNKKQLEEIRTKSAFFIQRRPNVNVSMEEEDWLLLGIQKELVRRGLELPDVQFRRNASYRNFLTISPKIRELLELAAPGLSLIERRWLGEIAAKCLADYLRVEINLRNMVEHATLIPLAINKAFPDYMEAGMLGLVVKKGKPSAT